MAVYKGAVKSSEWKIDFFAKLLGQKPNLSDSYFSLRLGLRGSCGHTMGTLRDCWMYAGSELCSRALVTCWRALRQCALTRKSILSESRIGSIHHTMPSVRVASGASGQFRSSSRIESNETIRVRKSLVCPQSCHNSYFDASGHR